MTKDRAETDANTPVFYDETGKRWRHAQALFIALSIITIGFTAWMVPQLLADRRIIFSQAGAEQQTTPATSTTKPLPVGSLVEQLSQSNTPIIGEGPLVRVIATTPAKDSAAILATDPFSGRTFGTLTKQDQAYLSGETYALQRYGKVAEHSLALTFDDGPDPTFTPQLLDLLSRESVQATFFVTGSNVVKYPELAQRIVREGHILANHTFSHAHLDYTPHLIGEQEINQTQRILAATANQTTAFFRPPYAGRTDQSLRNALTGILTGQKLGYINAIYDTDSNDWRLPAGDKPNYPKLDGSGAVVLAHDGGGDRHMTIGYIEKLIQTAKQRGYHFANLDVLYPEYHATAASHQATLADRTTFGFAWSVLVLPKEVVTGLFGLSIVTILCVTTLNISLAIIQRRRTHYAPRAKRYRPFVSIIVPAYNEGVVLHSTVNSLLASTYRRSEIIIVDDGSTDNTWSVAQSLASTHKTVRAIHQVNGGKATALNRGIKDAKGSIIIGVDADTTFMPNTVENLVRHFQDKTVGAVAGVVRVGNIHGLLTLWQALEYTLSINIERGAHAYLGSIMIVPGACGAWRKSAIKQAGGVSHSTLAEDCDLTLRIQQLGHYKILQDNEAISYTEAPEKLSSLIKQRFRWTFGSIQALFKYRSMIFGVQYRALTEFVMPYAVISILIPLFFWPILSFITIQNILSGNYTILLLYFAVTLALQFIVALIGIVLGKAPLRLLLAVPFARFIYGPIRVYVLYKTVMVALRGSYVGWNKLVRTGTNAYKSGARTAH